MYSRLTLFLALFFSIKYSFDLIEAYNLLARVDRKHKIPRTKAGQIKVKLLRKAIEGGELQYQSEVIKAIALLRKCDTDIYIVVGLLMMTLLGDPAGLHIRP